jgi:SAM-dependent MidA family methyltransferase
VNDRFEEMESDLQPTVRQFVEGRLSLQEGETTEIGLEAVDWIRRIGKSLRRGYHLAIDYGYLRAQYFAQPHGTLMCYWRHEAVENPYIRIGKQDMTAHVNFSDLMEEPSLETVLFETQKDYLIRLGILDEIERLATNADAVSIQRLLKIKKLILPGSMGERFKVLVQTKK